MIPKRSKSPINMLQCRILGWVSTISTQVRRSCREASADFKNRLLDVIQQISTQANAESALHSISRYSQLIVGWGFRNASNSLRTL